MRGWNSLRTEDKGQLWEHLVLETLLSELDIRRLYYWRDKQKREIDFVIDRGDGRVDAVECKWQVDRFRSEALAAFRRLHPHGDNYLLIPATESPYVNQPADDLHLVVTDLAGWSTGQAQRLASQLD